MASFTNIQEINLNSNDIVINKTKQLSTQEIHNKIYQNQILEIFKLTTSFLLSNIFIRLLDNTFFSYYLKNKLLYFALLLFFMIGLTIIASYIFTYLEITNEEDKFLESLNK